MLRSSRTSAVNVLRATQQTRGLQVPAALGAIASRVFNRFERRAVLPQELFEKFEDSQITGDALSKSEKNQHANHIKQWALARGAVTYAHLFTPIRNGIVGEKHDSFIDLNYSTGDIVVDFSGTKLYNGETDGSSFPNGGLRATHTAGAYTTWDTSSAPFIRNDVLYIPTTFVSYEGDSLDEKTPLLRSQQAVNDNGMRLLKALGDTEAKRVVSNVGWEQEFFVISRDNFLSRPDLINTTRTLIGQLPPLNQQTCKNYFGPIPLNVRDFMRDVQKEFWALGISMCTIHNEVAPGQHETAPIFSITNVAADLNVVAMDIMNNMAARHGLAVLFHEKPFKGINGSGKHCNWGLNTDSGKNLFVAGKTEADQRQFIAMTAALTRAVHLHGDVLRVGVSGAGNDHRLGAHEAPPAIISLGTGKYLEEHLDKVLAGGPLEGYGTADPKKISFGTNAVQDIETPVEDRNRTAPMPFCGNRFEFRAVGSTQNIAFPMALLNTICAESMGYMADEIESGKSVEEVVRQILKDHKPIIFNGDGYSAEWPVEAAKRGLPNNRDTVAALSTFNSQKNQDLFSRMGVFRPAELEGRTNILFDLYQMQLHIEAETMLNMVRTGLSPACMQDLNDSQAGAAASPAVKKFVDRKAAAYGALFEAADTLEAAVASAPEDGDERALAEHAGTVVKEALEACRDAADGVEKVLPDALYPFPKYEEILYSHHPVGEGEHLA